MDFNKFVADMPSDQNAMDVFADRWAHATYGPDMAERLRASFEGDGRPLQAVQAFGVDGSLQGLSVLECGPLEGGHTYSLERAGAQVTAVEGNVEAYLKCLIVKEALGLRSKFLLGSFLPLLESRVRRYDLVFASGVLYHMSDPVRLLKAISTSTDQVYIWTHYHDPADPTERMGQPVVSQGFSTTYHRVKNENSQTFERWWGGLEDTASWMAREDVVEACRYVGFRQVNVLNDAPYSKSMPAHITLTCHR